MVSGSRTWKDRAIIWADLDQMHAEARRRGERMVLIHGECPRGADKHAEDWHQQRILEGATDLDIERYPPNRKLHGKRAEWLRNQAMVQSMPDRAYFYRHDESQGTTNALNLARSARLPRTLRERYGNNWDAPHIRTFARPIPGLDDLRAIDGDIR
jgi:hypothetical protein